MSRTPPCPGQAVRETKALLCPFLFAVWWRDGGPRGGRRGGAMCRLGFVCRLHSRAGSAPSSAGDAGPVSTLRSLQADLQSAALLCGHVFQTTRVFLALHVQCFAVPAQVTATLGSGLHFTAGTPDSTGTGVMTSDSDRTGVNPYSRFFSRLKEGLRRISQLLTVSEVNPVVISGKALDTGLWSGLQ